MAAEQMIEVDLESKTMHPHESNTIGFNYRSEGICQIMKCQMSGGEQKSMTQISAKQTVDLQHL